MRNLISSFVVICILTSTSFADVVKLSKLTIERNNEILSCYEKQPIIFSPDLPQFEKNNAYGLAFFSYLVYSDEETVENTVRSLGFTKVKFIKASKEEWKTLPDGSKRRILADTEAVWAENDNFVVLAFQGTLVHNKLNLLTDVMAKRVQMGKLGKVHSGFYGALTIAWPQIYQLMREVKTAKPVFLTGHSLGAALAVLTSIKMLQREERETEAVSKAGPYLRGLYTFGAPKIGDDEFRKNVKKLFAESGGESYSARFVHNHDLVPHLPLFSLHQLDDLQYFDSRGDEFQGDEAVLKTKRPFFKKFILNYGFGDHDMRYYLEDTYLNLTGHLSNCL